jgi:hypothetical protein
MAGFGVRQSEIATLIACDAKTLRKYYRNELDIGQTIANAAVAESLFLMATRDKVPAAAIFWMKARAGWKEARDLNIGGRQDNPVAIDFTWAQALTQPSPVSSSPTIEAEAEVEDAEAGDVAVT